MLLNVRKNFLASLKKWNELPVKYTALSATAGVTADRQTSVSYITQGIPLAGGKLEQITPLNSNSKSNLWGQNSLKDMKWIKQLDNKEAIN